VQVLDGCSVRLDYYEVSQQLRVEFNPSRLVPDPYWICPPHELQPVLETVVGKVLHGVVQPAAKVEDWPLSRLDIARDFVVADPARWLAAAQDLRVPHHPTRRTYRRGGRVETVCLGKRRGAPMLYDKSRESGSDVSPRRLRWELQLQYPDLNNKFGVVGDVSPERTLRVAATRWTALRLDTLRVAGGSLVDELMRLDAVGRNAVLGWLTQLANGLEPGLNPRTERKHHDEAARLGLTVGDPVILANSSGAKLCLDFNTGREVAA